jgi:uncharacterized protein YutE (UPF0331/DUF86 family)
MDAALVARKLAQLRHQLDRARDKRPADAASFLNDEDAQSLVALAIFVAIQEAIDLAFYIIAAKGWGAPASYAETFSLLADRGVIDRALAQELSATVKVRNLVAHGYASIEPERLWNDLPAGLDALDRYAADVAKQAVSAT